MDILSDIIVILGMLYLSFQIGKLVYSIMRLKSAPQATLSVDGIALTFLFTEYTKDGNHFMRCYSPDKALQFFMTTDLEFENLYTADREQIKPNTTASIEIMEEIIRFPAMKTSIGSPDLGSMLCYNYQGLIEHDFEGHGHYLGEAYLNVCIPPDKPKRRRRRVWRKVELPKFNLPGLMPQPVRVPFPV